MSIEVTAYRAQQGWKEQVSGSHQLCYAATLLQAKEQAQALGHSRKGPSSEQPYVAATKVRINNALINDPNEPYVELFLLDRILGRDRTMMIAIDLSHDIQRTSRWHNLRRQYLIGAHTPASALIDYPELISHIQVSAEELLAEEAWVDWLRERGYDGAHYQRVSNPGASAYQAFDGGQVRTLWRKPLPEIERVLENARVAREAERSGRDRGMDQPIFEVLR